MSKKLVSGFGINDADYAVQPVNGNSRYSCNFYTVWHSMIDRCYSKSFQKWRPSYIGCTVCDDWKYFSNFKKWMEMQDWKNKSLDKDLLVKGNRIYSPDTCVFISTSLNNFVTRRVSGKGELPDGVFIYKKDGRFASQCSNPFTKKRERIGYFSTPSAAHEAWRSRKHELACQLADLESDERVVKSLKSRFL